MEQRCKQIDMAIEALMNQLPQHITSIQGVGPVTGAAILAP